MTDAHANFAYSTIATAPSPALSGTSLVVAAGQGAVFPVVPFNATVWPAGAQPLASNAEIVRVTLRSTDTLTITRTQEGSAARSIVAGDQIAATITAKTLTDAESLSTIPTTVQLAADGVPLTLRGAASQVGGVGSDLFDIKDGGGTKRIWATSDGDLAITGLFQYDTTSTTIQGRFDSNGPGISMDVPVTSTTILTLRRDGDDVLLVRAGAGSAVRIDPAVDGDVGLEFIPRSGATVPSWRAWGWNAAADDVFEAFEITKRGGIDLKEQPDGDLPAPAANTARIYVKDNGAGKTQLCVRFATGAVQVLATQP